MKDKETHLLDNSFGSRTSAELKKRKIEQKLFFDEVEKTKQKKYQAFIKLTILIILCVNPQTT